MNQYAPQGRHFPQQPAQQFSAPRPALQFPARQQVLPSRGYQQVPIQRAASQPPRLQQFPAQQAPARQARPRQFPAQQPAPAQQFPAQQPAPAQQFPARHAPIQYPPLPFVETGSSRRGPHPSLFVAFGVLVAALVITTFLLVQGTSQQTPVQTAGTPPTPPVPLTTSASTGTPTTTAPPTNSAPTTTAPPTTEEPTTSEPTTSEPTTSEPTTSKTTTSSGRAAVVREATAAAQAWAAAVSSGDAAGVRALSCRQDLEEYSDGDLTNPGALRGKYQFSFQKVVEASSADSAAIVRFGVSPKLGSLSTLDSYVTQQSGRWLVCISVTKLADL